MNCNFTGEGHNLQGNSMVFMRGGRVRDSPGVESHCIQGVEDLLGIPDEEEEDQNMVRKNPNRYEWKRNKVKYHHQPSHPTQTNWIEEGFVHC
ncbi:hypothetical protein NC653_010789 [Populus alba x Populus x berolinensis]|nr:hypothetical protein NC653_010789 [Populus alba x Populus x berolinensis]